MEFVDLILYVVRMLGRGPGDEVLGTISLISYNYLLMESAEETTAVALALVALRLISDDTGAAEFSEMAIFVDAKWQFSQLDAPHVLEVPWLIFCHALFLRMGFDVVPLFLSLSVISTIAKYLCIEADLEPKAYSLDLLAEMIADEFDPKARDIVLNEIRNTDDIIDHLRAITEDPKNDQIVFTLPDLEKQVPIANAAVFVLARLGNHDLDPMTFV
jgi:hypothetical protein